MGKSKKQNLQENNDDSFFMVQDTTGRIVLMEYNSFDKKNLL